MSIIKNEYLLFYIKSWTNSCAFKMKKGIAPVNN